MAQVVPAVARFELKYRNTDTNMENVYHVRTTSPAWTETEMDDVAAAFVEWENSTASLQRNNQVSLYEIQATDLTSLFGLRKAYPVAPPIEGVLINALPSNATVALKADIGRRGRGTAGRSFWVGLAEAQIAAPGDSLTTVAAIALITAMNDLRDAIAAVTPIEGLCIPHFVVGSARPPIVNADIVARYLLSDFYTDSMRDRLPNHKKHKRRPALPIG